MIIKNPNIALLGCDWRGSHWGHEADVPKARASPTFRQKIRELRSSEATRPSSLVVRSIDPLLQLLKHASVICSEGKNGDSDGIRVGAVVAVERKDACVEDGAYTPSNSASLVRFVLRVGGAHLPPLSFARPFFGRPSLGHSAFFIVVSKGTVHNGGGSRGISSHSFGRSRQPNSGVRQSDDLAHRTPSSPGVATWSARLLRE